MKNGILLLFILVPALSLAQPTVCPHVNQIKAIGLSHNLAHDNNGLWYAGRSSQFYGTPWKWTFVIGGFSARNETQARIRANRALDTLRQQGSVPKQSPAGKWLCYYSNEPGYMSGAATPPISPPFNANTLS